MDSKQVIRALIGLIVVPLLAACGTMSPFNGYVSAPPEARKAVDEGKFVEEVAAQIAIVQNPDFNGGKISSKALKKIQEYAMSCQSQIDSQLAGGGQSAAAGGAAYGAAGTGTGVAAKAAGMTSGGMTAAKYAIYGGVAYILPGAVNGLISGSYAMASAKGTCTRDFWEDVVKSDRDFQGTHVVVVYAGKSGNSTPPALDKSAAVPPSNK